MLDGLHGHCRWVAVVQAGRITLDRMKICEWLTTGMSRQASPMLPNGWTQVVTVSF